MLFTDLVGSTELLDRLGDDAANELRQAHFGLLRRAIAEAGGEEVKSLGDGIMAVFTSPVEAIGCAAAIQRAVADHNRTQPGPPLNVRIGLHAGEPVEEEGDFHGTPVVVARRLCDQAKGGQILASELVASLVGSRGNFRFRPAGRLQLKGLAQPLPAVFVEWAPMSPGAPTRETGPPATRARHPPAPRGPRLVGRAAELEVLEDERRRAVAGEFRFALIVGDPGVGKTRLASELLARHRRGMVALSARAYPLGSTASFALWAEALEHHLRTLPGAEVAALCGGFLDDLAGLLRSVAAVRGAAPHGEPSRSRLLEGLAVLVSNLADHLPVLLFLDDVHLADVSSWEALAYLARDVSDARILVVAAARPAELAEHPVAGEVLFSLEQEGLLRRLNLTPLHPDVVGELAGVVLGKEPSQRLTDWLAERSRGNPLFALGLLQALLDEGADLSAPALRRLPEGLADRVKGRLRLLDEPALAVLEVIAVLGRRVEATDLVRLSARPLDRLGTILESLVAARLVLEEEHGRDFIYEIAHPLIAETIYQNIGGARRKALHRLVARTLLSSGRLGEAALHFARAAEVGDAEAVEALRDALRQAEEAGAYGEALEILGVIGDLLPSGDPRWMDVADALSLQAAWVTEHRADVHAVMGIKALRELDVVLERSSDLVRRATVKHRLYSFLAWGTGELEEAERACREAGELFGAAGERARALLAANELAWSRGLAGDYAGLEVNAAEVYTAAEAAGEGWVALNAIVTAAWGAFLRSRFDAAEAAWERALIMARQQANLYRVPYCRSGQAITKALDGRIAEAWPLLEEARGSGSSFRETLLVEQESWVHWLAGDFNASLRTAREVIAWNPKGLSRRRWMNLSFALLAAIEADDLDQARTSLDQARSTFGDAHWLFLQERAAHLEGLLAWREGNVLAAVAAFRQAASRLVKTEFWPVAAFTLLDLAEAAVVAGEPGVAQEAAEDLRKAARRLGRPLYQGLGRMGQAWAALASGTTGGETAALAREAVEFLSGAGYRAFYGRALDLLGHSQAASDRAGAREALQQAARTFEMCGAVWRRQRTLESLSNLGGAGRRAATAGLGSASLTRREREVARLAGQGLTAGEIGDRLFIGRRTVEGYLASVYAKLGVDSKVELVRRLAEFDL